jgi:DNA-binding NtrC family response regulator
MPQHPRAAVCPRLLLVDDDLGSLKAIARLLKRDFELTAVSCAQAALTGFGPLRFEIALIDHRMKPMTGVELLAHLRVRDPSVRRILMSAGLVPELDDYMELGLVQGFLPKPLDPRHAYRMLLHEAPAASASANG